MNKKNNKKKTIKKQSVKKNNITKMPKNTEDFNIDNNLNKIYYAESSNKKRYSNKISNMAEEKNMIKAQSLFKYLSVFVLVFFLLAVRLIFIQFVDGATLKESANRQQTTNRTIPSQRGAIYDSTGKALAISANVDTVSINPKRLNVTNDDGTINEVETNAKKDKIAQAFADIFTLDVTNVRKQLDSTSDTEIIAKKVEKDKIDNLKNWMKETEISVGINIDPDTKRYYPYNNLASNLIGFCGTDGQGLWGIESYWDDVLAGTPGKIVSTTDVAYDLVPDKDSTYISAQNGSDITLSIDYNIQSIAEKYLKQAVIENDCKDGGNVIIMKPSTGDVLAMASYPDYNLNTPFEPNETLQAKWSTMNSSQKNTALNQMWGNKAISHRYEPGSTYKVINAAIGLEENIVEPDTPNDFSCIGYETVAGTKIHCWRQSNNGHGNETMRQVLMNSCNPGMIQLGQRIGSETLYKYYDAFGLFDRTNIQTTGESSSYYWNLENVGPIELATMSFGQRFTITPIQLITAVSSIANDGILMQPRIVTQLKDVDTGNITTVEPKEVRQVVSKETCDQLINMLESVVSDGGGSYGSVSGYTIAGKTGTSEPNPDSPEDGYVASFVGIAPSQNPEVVVLVVLYNPQGEKHMGGQIAGPVVSQILTEVLPYLGIPSDTAEPTNTNSTSTISVPDVRNKTVAEAKKILEDAGFSCKVSSSDTNSIITDQVPKPGTALISGSTICIYTSGNEARISQEVPNLKGKSLSSAISLLKAKNLNIHASGTGQVVSQEPMAGTSVEEGTVISVKLQPYSEDAH